MNREEMIRSIKNIIGVGVILLAAFNFNLMSQTQTVSQNSTYNYFVAQSITGSTFNWNVTGGTNGIHFNYSSTNTNTIAITWLQTGNYIVQVTEVSPQNCINPNAPVQLNVQVIPPATIQFSSVSSAACSGLPNTNLELTLSFTGTPIYPIVVNYTVNGTPRQRTINSGTTINLGSEDNILENLTANDVNKVIVITSATSHGANLIIGTNNTHTFTVYATPQLNPITQN